METKILQTANGHRGCIMFTAIVIFASVAIPSGLLLFALYVEKWVNRYDVKEYGYETV